MPTPPRLRFNVSPPTSKPHQAPAQGSKMQPTIASSSTSPSSPAAATSLAATTNSLHEPAFICTICWQAQFPPSTPKLLGTSSRIVCRPCWRAVLDLSICWVCGECIVRGDEVVSLGWCFWHRGCFGCLVCGTRMRLEGGSGEGEWGKWDGGLDDSGEWKGRKRRIGVELDIIPLCAACGVETEGENDKKVLERGLDTVSRFDGGLSRNRLDMLILEEDERRTERTRWKPPRRYKGSSGLERDLKKFINGSSGSSNRWSEYILAEDQEPRNSLVQNAGRMGISEDGNADDDDDHHHQQSYGEVTACEHAEERGHDVYLSVFDPTGEAAFKPSKTKPLPKWMSLLPSNVQRNLEQHRGDETKSYQIHHELESLGDSAEHNDALAPPRIQTDSMQSSEDTSTPKAPSRVQITGSVAAEPHDLSTRPLRRQSTISIHQKPKKEFHNRDTSQIAKSILPRLLDPPSPIPVRQKTPYPGNKSLSISLEHTKMEESTSIPLGRESCCGMRGESLGSVQDSTNPGKERLERLITNNMPSFINCSSEYIDKYAPEVTDNRYRKYEAKAVEPILEKIKRQKIGKQNMAQGTEERFEERSKVPKSTKIEGEEYGLDPRREDLKRELRNLFCEE